MDLKRVWSREQVSRSRMDHRGIVELEVRWNFEILEMVHNQYVIIILLRATSKPKKNN